jgi:hypothetical protein
VKPPRPDLALPREDRERSRVAVVVSVALHVVAIAFLATAITLPMIMFTRPEAVPRNTQERVTFMVAPADEMQLPRPETTRRPAQPPTAAREPERPIVSPVTPPVTPPVTQVPVPTTVPNTLPGHGTDSAMIGYGGRPIPGLTPGRTDPRLLGILALPTPDAPMQLQRISLDSAVASWVATSWDSVARAQGSARNPLDWTVERNGKKYGVDPGFIYFGKFKVPTALLAAIPLKVQANPTAVERNRALDVMRADIMYQAMRATTEEDFKSRIQAIKERVDKQRRDSLQRIGKAGGG